eukprot:s532_g12.t1
MWWNLDCIAWQIFSQGGTSWDAAMQRAQAVKSRRSREAWEEYEDVREEQTQPVLPASSARHRSYVEERARREAEPDPEHGEEKAEKKKKGKKRRRTRTLLPPPRWIAELAVVDLPAPTNQMAMDTRPSATVQTQEPIWFGSRPLSELPLIACGGLELPDETQDDEHPKDEDGNWEDSEAEVEGEDDGEDDEEGGGEDEGEDYEEDGEEEGEDEGEDEKEEAKCFEDSAGESVDGCPSRPSGSKGEAPNPGSIFDDDVDEDVDEPGSNDVKNPKSESLGIPSSDGSRPDLNAQILELQKKLALAKKEFTAKTPNWFFVGNSLV